MEEEVQRKRSRSKSTDRGSSRDRIRRRRSSRSKSRSRSRNVRRSRSRSISPLRSGWSGGFRGGRRFNRRSPPFRGGRGFGRDRFRRSRSTSRGRFDRRRYDEHDHRRSRSVSPSRSKNFNQQPQHQQPAPISYGNEAYVNYGVPQFPGSMAQFNTYDYQANYPPAPNFDMNAMGMGAACPAPPGLTDWQPPQAPILTEPDEEKQKREAAIAEEKKRQREGLKKQRDQYISRSEKMKRELKMLKEQKSGFLDGLGKRSPSPKTSGFIKENDKLQTQISTKLSEVLNVIDMLNGIIGKESDEEEDRKESDSDSSPERIKSKLLESMGKGKKKEVDEKKQKVNYIYYDPELHWCKPCQAFPKTAQDYLNHLHTKEHLEKIATRTTEAPWRSGFQKTNEVPSYPDAPTKRAPIKGLQFFEPATAWFCKLCEMFMGDSWCTSLHLKSAIHAERYAKFIEKEPKFEEKWLEARNKAFENFGSLDSIVNEHQKAIKEDSNDKKSLDKKKKKKNKKDSKKKRKRGKKRKHSSSSSDSDDDSDSSSSSDSESKKNESNSEGKNSIRVAMRNFSVKGGNDSEKSGWTMVSLDPNKPPIPPPPAISQNASKETKKDEQIINQWNTVEPIISQEEKRLLENLKGRYKQNKIENEKPVAIPPPPQVSSRRKSRERSRSKERRNERNFRGRKSRTRSKSPVRRRSNSRDRRRSNSRDRRRSNSRDRKRSTSRDRDRRRSPRYGRRYSRNRSRSPRFTRPHIVFPTEPRLPPLREEKKQPARSYVITKKEEPQVTSSALANASKKMPIIGKMPVFKKLTTEKKSENQTEEKMEDKQINNAESLEEKNNQEDWNDLMPDPMQYTAMMNAAQPVPPVANEQPDAPPGLDPEMDSEFIPKPISDAPPPRKGPLPKDLQATLDILFDGDSIKPVVIEPTPMEAPLPVAMPIDTDGPQMIMAEEISQHSILYSNYDIQPVPAPPVISKKVDTENGTKKDEEDDEENQKNEDMDDLAMLGIDVNDVGSGLW